MGRRVGLDIAGFYAEIDAAVAGVATSCRAGCAACCRQLVPIAPLEARRLRQVVNEMNPAKRLATLTRFAKARSRLDAAGLLDLLADPAAVPADGLEMLGRQYLAENVACPFLVDERCSIYTDRPAACRGHAVTSPPSECSREGGRVRRVPLPRGLTVAALCSIGGSSWRPLATIFDD